MHHPLVTTKLLPQGAVRPSAEALLASDWLLFTSRSAVQAWAALGLPLVLGPHVRGPKLGAVGARTAADLTELGGHVALSAQPENARGLLETFVARVAPPARVGLPCGEGALPTLPDGLTGAGFSVTQAHLYRTVTQHFPNVAADLIVLASPSAVAALPEALEPGTQLVALGPSTCQAIRNRGWRATQAAAPTLRGVAEAVLTTAREPLALETP